LLVAEPLASRPTMPAASVWATGYRVDSDWLAIPAVKRASSIKRVASAVGEGSVAISQVHAYLEQSQQAVKAD